jgi:hypothetical protein
MELSFDTLVLKDLVSTLRPQIGSLLQENTPLRIKGYNLRFRLNQNNTNSHKPPSSDGLMQMFSLTKNPTRKGSVRNSHKGKTLEVVTKLDAVERVRCSKILKTMSCFVANSLLQSCVNSKNVFQNMINAFDGENMVFQAG